MSATHQESKYSTRMLSLFEIFWGRLANWFRRLAQWRKLGLLRKALESKRKRAFRLEPLEPRVLLSADISYGAGALDLANADGTETINKTDFLDSGDGSSSDALRLRAEDAGALPSGDLFAASDLGDHLNIDLSRISDQSDDQYGPEAALTGGAASFALTVAADFAVTDDANAAGGITLTVDSSSETIFGVGGSGLSSALLDEPLANAAYDDQAAVETSGQVVFLSFGGAEDVDYEGPVHIDDIDVAAFGAPAGLEGQRSEIVSSVVATLKEEFAGSGIVFITERPGSGEYSTIHIGGDGEAFSDYGSYYGLAEKVDAGNTDHSDIAFIFSGKIGAQGLTAQEYGAKLGGYAAHELGHLLGFEHAHESTTDDGPLATVAFDPKVHVEIGMDARADAIDDGMVTINGIAYAVHPKLVEALTNHLPFYNAGAVGGDAFPDVVMGQFAIHPVEHGVWLTRVLDMAWLAQDDPWFTSDEKSEILAWSYGLLTHSAGDHFAHTLVNQFAEGVAPGFVAAAEDARDLGNMLRHFMTEAYIADALEGVDTNPDVTLLPDGDYSDVSTLGIDFDAPARFIYEALIRPFPEDPTAIVEMKWTDGTLSAAAASDTFTRTTGSFTDDGFKVGHKITVSGFANAANNGTFIVTAVTGTALTIDGELADEAASGGEKIKVSVPFTEQTAITVNDATNSFVRTSGSFKADGFVEGQRFTIYGSHNYHGDYIVKSVSDDGLKLTVYEDLNSGYEVGNGDEQLVVQGSRGAVLDKIFQLQDKLELEAIERGPRQDFAQLLLQYAAAQIDPLVTAPSTDQLLGAYFYNWVEDIDASVENWGDVGLAFAKAMWDAQSKRDLQNIVGDETGQADLPGNTIRRDAEAGVGVLDVFFHELDDPNNDGDHSDGYINQYLLPAIGLPDFTGDVREALGDVAAFLDALVAPIVEPIEAFFLPIQEAIVDFEDAVKDYLAEQIEERFGVSVEIFEFLTELSSKMDLASIDVGSLLNVPVFKPGDHERLDALLGLTGDHHEDPPAGLDLIPFATFYTPTEGRLTDAAHFSKTGFAAYANSVTLTKMLYLMESPTDGSTIGAGQLSQLYSDLIGTDYDFTLLNMHGAHGGNVLTTTLPGVGGTEAWMDSIDGDEMWRQDSYTTTSALFRVSTQNDGASPAAWTAPVVIGAEYRIYATWQANVTQLLDNLENSAQPNQHISPASNAQYTIKDGTTAFVAGQPAPVDQHQYAGDPDFTTVEEDGLAYRLLGTYTFTTSMLGVELSNVADGHVIAGPLLIERV